MNSSKIVYIDNLQPDANGELLLNFSTTAEAAYGFNGGVIVEDYNEPDQINSMVSNFSVVQAAPQVATTEEDALMAARTSTNGMLRMYPNPFVDFLNMDFTNTAAENVLSMEVYDLSGRITYRRHLGKLPKGANTVRLGAEEAGMKTGIYVVTLSVNGKAVQANKVIRLVN